MTYASGRYQIIDVDTGRPLRGNKIATATNAVKFLYSRIIDSRDDRDFVVVDEQYQPVPASRLRKIAEAEHRIRSLAAKERSNPETTHAVRDATGRFVTS